MALETWPNSIDYLINENTFSIVPNDSVTRTEFDDGPVMVRMRFSNPTTVYNGVLTLTNNEFTVFRGFYQSTLNQGTAWFTMPIWIGTEYAVQKCRFKKLYDVTDQGFDQNNVTISLEVRDYFTYDAFASYVLGFFGIDVAVNEVADPLQIIVNIDYPEVMYFYQFPDYVRYLLRLYGQTFVESQMEVPIQTATNTSYPHVMTDYR